MAAKDVSPMVAEKGLSYAKLQVMSDVGYCLKTKSQGLNYTFASESELIAALRPALIEHDITVSPVDCELLESVQYETKRGGRMFVARVKTTYRFTHAPSGESEDVTVFGEGGDVGDKSLPKAMTCAYKYAIRQAFMIETGDDPDRHASQPGVSKLELQKQFENALDAVKVADTLETLEKYQHVYTDLRDFNDTQMSALQIAYDTSFTRLHAGAE